MLCVVFHDTQVTPKGSLPLHTLLTNEQGSDAWLPRQNALRALLAASTPELIDKMMTTPDPAVRKYV